jgi:hypothetical protein
MKEEITGDWRKICSDEPHDLYFPPDIIGMMKQRRMRCAVHVARMREGGRNTYIILVETS